MYDLYHTSDTMIIWVGTNRPTYVWLQGEVVYKTHIISPHMSLSEYAN